VPSCPCFAGLPWVCQGMGRGISLVGGSPQLLAYGAGVGLASAVLACGAGVGLEWRPALGHAGCCAPPVQVAQGSRLMVGAAVASGVAPDGGACGYT